jgi:hypothetical protein
MLSNGRPTALREAPSKPHGRKVSLARCRVKASTDAVRLGHVFLRDRRHITQPNYFACCPFPEAMLGMGPYLACATGLGTLQVSDCSFVSLT